jgi:acylphosphatase
MCRRKGLDRGHRQLKVRAHVLVSGEVQGVFFRQETQELANRLNVNGWVRNTHDDRVEAVFEGTEENVEELVEFCKKGPSYARVAKVEVSWENFVGEFKDFRIRF